MENTINFKVFGNVCILFFTTLDRELIFVYVAEWDVIGLCSQRCFYIVTC